MPILGSDAVSARPATGLKKSQFDARLGAFLAAAEGVFSGHTVRALTSDLARFAAWCAAHGVRPLPARAATVAAYIEESAAGRTPSTVRRYLSSIASAHRSAGEPSPAEHAEVQRALKRVRRRNACRPAQALGLTWTLLLRLTAATGGRTIDARNRAMLAVAYDAMLRRSELVALQVNDLYADRGGSASLLVRRAKTDPEGRGAMLYLHHDTVRLVGDWLDAGGIGTGPLFRSVRRSGTLGGALPESQVPRIYKAMAERAGLAADEVGRIAGHSPRVGAAQDMIASGIEVPAIMQAGRWRSASMVQRYGEHLLPRRNGAAQLARLQKRG